MSLEQVVSISCPQCQTDQQVTIWTSINVQVDPTLKEELFNGNINTFHCPSCDLDAVIPVALMYHDMALKYTVQYLPFNLVEEDDPGTLGGYLPDGTNKAMLAIPPHLRPGAEYILKPHIVFDMGELLRYVVFRDKQALFQESDTP